MKNLIEKVKNDKKLLLVIAIAALLIITGVVLVFNNDDNTPGKEENGTNIQSQMTKEEATNLIKSVFHGDNYQFECERISGGNYKVVVTNKISGKTYNYFVDAATKTYVLKTD